MTKKFNEGNKRSVYWNEYKSKIETKEADAKNLKRLSFNACFHAVNKLFVLTFNDVNNDANRVQRDSHRKYFLPRVNITNYNVLVDGRNFYNQPINDQMERYDEIKMVATGK